MEDKSAIFSTEYHSEMEDNNVSVKRRKKQSVSFEENNNEVRATYRFNILIGNQVSSFVAQLMICVI